MKNGDANKEEKKIEDSEVNLDSNENKDEIINKLREDVSNLDRKSVV